MPVVVTDERKLPLGVHRVQMHRVQASIPYSRNLSREKLSRIWRFLNISDSFIREILGAGISLWGRGR